MMSKTTRADWDAYWQHFEAKEYVNYIPQVIETIEAHVELAGCQVLEIGAGTGGSSSILASLGARVVTLDFSMPALERTTATADGTGVSLERVQGDAWYLPFASRSFDLVFHQGFLEHFEDPSRLLAEQKRVLRKGGYLLVDVPQRYNWYTVHKRRMMRKGEWPYGGWEREFSLGELRTLVEAVGFRALDAYGRGYYPRFLAMLRELAKIETKVLKRQVLPRAVWELYDRGWQRFERTGLGCYTLQSIGLLAQAGTR
jgi:SAM-dependent methyltransferase